MQINKKLLVWTLAAYVMAANADSAPALAASAGIKGSIATVDELIKRENAALLATAGAKSGSGESSNRLAQRPPNTPSVEVLSIYGTAASIRTNLMVDGSLIEGAGIGAKVGPCGIKAIAQRCVLLEPAVGASQKQCLTTCWTGVSKMSVLQQGLPLGLPTGGLAPSAAPQVMPMPGPLPPSAKP